MDKYKGIRDEVRNILILCKTKDEINKTSFKLIDIIHETASDVRYDMITEEIDVEELIANLSKEKPEPKIKEQPKKIKRKGSEDQLSILFEE